MAASPFDIIAQNNHFVATKYFDLATCVVIFYDHSLTFDMEVENIWTQKRSFPKLLWFVFRYGAPLIQIGCVLADQLTWTTSSCQGWLWFRLIALQIVVIAVNSILILRVWALFEKASWSLMVMLSTLLSQAIVTIWSYEAIIATTAPDQHGCLPAPKYPNKVSQVASLFVVLLVMEVVIFTLSIFRIAKLAAKGSSPTPLVSVILRDGIPYFFINCLVSLANVLLIELPGVPTDIKPINTQFTPVIIVIMVSRLFLNLRASANSPAADFTLVGNLGEPVQYDLGRIEIRVTTDHVTYTDDGAVALEELRHPKGRPLDLAGMKV